MDEKDSEPAFTQIGLKIENNVFDEYEEPAPLFQEESPPPILVKEIKKR